MVVCNGITHFHALTSPFAPQRAYYFGSRMLVEVDIVLPETMPLKESHDIGESLQFAIERLENVERVRVTPPCVLHA